MGNVVLVEMTKTRRQTFLTAQSSSARTIPPNMSVTWLAHGKKENAPEVSAVTSSKGETEKPPLKKDPLILS